MQEYRTLYPNHAHQLTVSVSKHYWITNDGILKYQNKKMEVTLDKVGHSPKNHLIHFILRDHCSGAVYSEVTSSRSILSLSKFLYKAWSQKEDYVFCGIPELLTIPKTVEAVFPEIKEKVMSLGIECPQVTSGFQAGVRDVKTIEEYMKFFANLSFIDNHSSLNKIYSYISSKDARIGKQSKIEMWRSNINSVTIPHESWLETTN